MSKGICVLLFNVFNGSSLKKKFNLALLSSAVFRPKNRVSDLFNFALLGR